MVLKEMSASVILIKPQGNMNIYINLQGNPSNRKEMVTIKCKCEHHSGARGIVRGSPELIGFTLWGP